MCIRKSSRKSEGISLISLIITIIVIIILAAIVIFTGLSTPDRAQFSKFASEFSDFQTAVTQDFFERKKDYSVANQTRSDAQIYYEIASGTPSEMNRLPIAEDYVEALQQEYNIQPEPLKGKEIYLITSDTNVAEVKSNKNYYETSEKHFVTDEGETFTLPGYRVEEGRNNQVVH